MVKTERRPSTATLIKPTILDARLLGIFDMTTVSREHLVAIKNLVHSTPRCKCRPMSKSLALKCDQPKPETVQGHEKIQKVYKVLNKTYRIRTNVRQKLHDLQEAAEIIEKPLILPAPCSTCGRSDQPERFHSHPSRFENQKKYVKDIEQKKTVQKPVAMKFRSIKTKLEEENEKEPAKKTPLNAKLKLEHKSPPKLQSLNITKKPPETSPSVGDKENTPKRKIKIPIKWREVIKKSVQQKRELVQEENSKPKDDEVSEGGYKLDNWNPAPVSGGRKRKVVCYLCSQEFGTAALPAHEAICIQRYLKQNNDQNPTDEKEQSTSTETNSPTIRDNWKLAWEITQASLVPCEFCDRKFLPARLEAHERICASKSNKEHSKSKVSNVSYALNPPGVQCEYCGKRYGSNSIVIHKEHCFKKSTNLSNDVINTETQDNKENSNRKSAPLTVICYICGRNFGTKSISFHEPQCLKKWKMENEKLPINLQKSFPIKLDISELEAGLSYETQELFWKAHQAQLVPCPKCSRTFFPDRLEVHLKGCKGPSKNKK